MEYSRKFEKQISEFEAVAIRMQIDESEQARQQFVLCLDDLINTYSLNYTDLADHAEEVQGAIARDDPTNRNLQYINTLHTEFLDKLCEDYDPQY